jgi:hypothetical protein
VGAICGSFLRELDGSVQRKRLVCLRAFVIRKAANAVQKADNDTAALPTAWKVTVHNVRCRADAGR